MNTCSHKDTSNTIIAEKIVKVVVMKYTNLYIYLPLTLQNIDNKVNNWVE